MKPGEPGHRRLPHAADCLLEAWGPDRAACLTEALLALVETFAEVDDSVTAEVLPLATSASGAEDALVSLLEEVIYVVDALGVVPVRFHLAEAEDGGLAGDMEVVPASSVVLVGPVPKAVSYHALEIASFDGGWRCRALVDV
jgi:SHS2 domain-containing protein